MISLRELQRNFSRGILGDEVAAAVQFILPGGFSGERRLQVYRNNVFASLTEALREVFPVVARLVGDGFFFYAAHEYIVRHPSRSGNLHDFGEHFPDFFRQFGPAQEHRYLPDVAALEWAWHRAYHAADHDSPLAIESLARVPAGHYSALRFTLHPASRLVSSEYPVLRIWEVNQESFAEAETVDLDSGGDKLLVIRPKSRVVIIRLSDGEFAFLNALAGDIPFEAACEAALDTEENLDITACLQSHVLSGTLVGFRV